MDTAYHFESLSSELNFVSKSPDNADLECESLEMNKTRRRSTTNSLGHCRPCKSGPVRQVFCTYIDHADTLRVILNQDSHSEAHPHLSL